MSIAYQLSFVRGTLPEDVTLVAVSKTHPAGAIREAYDAGTAFSARAVPRSCVKNTTCCPRISSGT